MWEIQLLGGVTLRKSRALAPGTDDDISRFRTRKVGELLAYLVLNPGPQSRELLATMLWPEVDTEQGRNNFRVCLSSLRAQVEPPGTVPGSILSADRHTVQLRAEAFNCDALNFQEICKRDGGLSGDPDVGAMKAAFDLYRGHLLAGYCAEWSHSTELYLESLFEQLSRALIHRHLRHGLRQEALTLGHRAAQILFDHEDFARLVDQIKDHEPITDHKPSGEVGAGGETASPAAGAGEPTGSSGMSRESADAGARLRSPSPLPYYPTAFHGRENEIEALLQTLDAGAAMQLLTLTGAPGIGKTRLAVEAARAAAARSATRVHFIAVSALSSPTQLAEAFRVGLGLSPSMHIEPLDQVSTALTEECEDAGRAGGRVLLIVDNLEHLLPQAALILQTLRARVPSLVIWVTSRALLRLSGEATLLVEGLPWPQSEDELQAVLASPSVRLFVQRARSARPNFSVTDSNAAAVSQLCRRLEGWPLALELAASRSHSYTPAQMIQHLQNDDVLLRRKVARSAADLTRQSSMHAAIEWSYCLLAPPTAAFFIKLAIFRGGAGVQETERVTENRDAVMLLAELVGHSLVVCDEKNGRLRYGLLEGVRQFARLQFSDSEWLELGRRHCETFATMLRDEATWTGDKSLEWHEKLDEERDNLRAALEWAEEQDPSLLLEMCGSLWRHWESRGLIQEGRKWLQRALQLQEPNSEKQTRATVEAFNGVARLCFGGADFEPGCEAAENALVLAREGKWTHGVANALLGKGLNRLYQGQVAEARLTLEESCETFERCGDLSGELHALIYSGIANTFGGAYDVSYRMLQCAIEKARAVENAHLARALFFCGDLLGPIAGLHEEAASHFTETLQRSTRNEDLIGAVYATWGLCHAAIGARDLDAAQRRLRHVDRVCAEIGYRWGQVFVIEAAAAMAVVEDDWKRVAVLLGAAESAREELVCPLIASYYMQFDRRFGPLWDALPPGELQTLWVEGRRHSLAQALELVRGRSIAKSMLRSRAVASHGMDGPVMGFPLDRRRARPLLAESHYGCGRLATYRGDRPSAHRHLTQALGLWRELGDTGCEDAARAWMREAGVKPAPGP